MFSAPLPVLHRLATPLSTPLATHEFRGCEPQAKLGYTRAPRRSTAMMNDKVPRYHARYAVFTLVLVVPAILAIAATPFFKPVKTYISAPRLAISIAIGVADVNRDGKPDLLVGDVDPRASKNFGYVGVLLGNGSGTFGKVHLYPTQGHYLTALASADFNGDGNIDVAVSTSEGAAVLLGNGNGSFQPAQTYNIDAIGGCTGVVIADVNGDGHSDLLLALLTNPNNARHGAAGLMLGNGDGSFGTVQLYDAGDPYSRSIAVADINLDGNLDLVLDNSTSTTFFGSVGVMLGNGDGTFQGVHDYDMGGFDGGSVTVADLNGDGNPDIVAANTCANNNCSLSTLGILLGNGNGTFQATKVIVGTGGWGAVGVAVTDISGDGTPDLLVDNLCDNSDTCDHGS